MMIPEFSIQRRITVFISLCDTIRTTTNRVESRNIRYGVIEPDNLRLKKMENIPAKYPCQISLDMQ